MTRIRYEVRPIPKRERRARQPAGEPALLWQVVRDGERLAAHATKAQSVEFAATTARCAWRTRRQLAELVIKGRDGKIQDTRTYGADPATTKG